MLYIVTNYIMFKSLSFISFNEPIFLYAKIKIFIAIELFIYYLFSFICTYLTMPSQKHGNAVWVLLIVYC